MRNLILARSLSWHEAGTSREIPPAACGPFSLAPDQAGAGTERGHFQLAVSSVARSSRQSGASDRKGLAAPPESSARVSASSSAFAREDGAALRPPQPVGVEDGRRGQDRQEESVGAGVGGPRREAERTTPPGVGVEGPPDDDPGTSLCGRKEEGSVGREAEGGDEAEDAERERR